MSGARKPEHGSEESELRAMLEQTDPERFAELVGAELFRDVERMERMDERFLRWLAAELREREPVPTEAEFLARGAAFRARVEAKRLRVLRRDEPQIPIHGAAHAAEASADLQSMIAARRGDPVPFIDLGIAAGVGRELWHEPVESFVVLPDEVPDGRYLALKIVGDSMAPLMHSGDTVLVRVGSDVAKDTVVVARHPDDGYVCKRVARVRRDSLELASLQPGLPRIRLPHEAGLIVGTVVLVWCSHRDAAAR